MAKRKNNLQNHFKKPLILAIIAIAVMGGFWMSFISITTRNTSSTRAAAATSSKYVAGQVVFGVKKGYTPSASSIRSISGYSDATVTKLYDDIYLLKSSKLLKNFKSLSSSTRSKSTASSLDKYTSTTISKLKSNSNITNATPDQTIQLLETPNDPSFSQQWALNKIEMPAGWEKGGNNEVIVGVLDSGVEHTHPDLKNMMWTNYAEKNGKSGVDDDKNAVIDDDHGFPIGTKGTLDTNSSSHGTHIAGTIAAQWGNSVGIAGICKTCKIMALKAFGDDGVGTESNIIKAMAYAISMEKKGLNLRVINHSYKVANQSPWLEHMFLTAGREGIISVAAAGNDKQQMVGIYPAQFTSSDMVFSVIATQQDDKKADFSNYGKTDSFVDFSAPGDGIYSLSKTNYQYMSGTSMAAPHVAGLIAVMASIKPNIKYSEVKEILKETSDNIDSLNHSSYKGNLGFGRINARKALEKLWNEVNGSQEPTPTSVPTSTPKPSPTTAAAAYQLTVTSPSAGFTYATPLVVGVTGKISGSPVTSYVDLKVFKYPISTSTPLASRRVTSFTNVSGGYTFSSIISTNITTSGEYVLQVIPYNSSGAIIGTHKEVRFMLKAPPATPTRTPTPTPRSGSIITPTGSIRF